MSIWMILRAPPAGSNPSPAPTRFKAWSDTSRTARDQPPGRPQAPPGIVVADHKGGGDREQQDGGGEDENKPRKVMIEEQAEKRRRHRRAQIEARIDKAKDRTRGPRRSSTPHQHIARRSGATPSESGDGNTRDQARNR